MSLLHSFWIVSRYLHSLSLAYVPNHTEFNVSAPVGVRVIRLFVSCLSIILYSYVWVVANPTHTLPPYLVNECILHENFGSCRVMFNESWKMSPLGPSAATKFRQTALLIRFCWENVKRVGYFKSMHLEYGDVIHFLKAHLYGSGVF